MELGTFKKKLLPGTSFSEKEMTSYRNFDTPVYWD
jgi:hypothetical protein